MRLSSVAPYRWIAGIYIELFRGLPALIVLAFGLLPLAFPGLIIPYDPYGTVWIALGIVAAAYMAETIRAGIQAVPKGSRGGSHARYAGRDGESENRAPPSVSDHHSSAHQRADLAVKDSSLAYILGLSAAGYELTKYGRDLSSTNANLTPLVIAGLCYLLITLPLTFVVQRMEARAREVGDRDVEHCTPLRRQGPGRRWSKSDLHKSFAAPSKCSKASQRSSIR